MSHYLFLFFLLACPLMMVVMMRGMHSGHDMGAKDKDADLPADQRIIDLERQVAELRAERQRIDSDASRR
jgi:hypothetical protein